MYAEAHSEVGQRRNELEINASCFNELEAIEDVAVLKKRLRLLLLQAANFHHDGTLGGSRSAYNLAGLLALSLVRGMDEKDPYRQLLEMAGQLEMPKRHQAPGTSWRRFEELAKLLRN